MDAALAIDGLRAVSPGRVKIQAVRAKTPELRPVSRGRTPAGKRKSLRFINDNLIAARSLWAHAGLLEDEVAERIAHMYISVEHHSVFETLLTDQQHRDVLVAFRRGELGAPVHAETPQKRRAPRVSEILSTLFARVNRRARALLLRHVRSEGSLGSAFVVSCEFALLSLMDGCGDDALKSAFDPAMEHIVLRAPLLQREEDNMGGAAWRGAGSASLTLALADGFHRLLVEGLAQFYGLRSETWEEHGEAGARCVKLTLRGTRGLEAAEAAPEEVLADRFGTAALATVRRALSAVILGAPPAVVEGSTSMDARESGPLGAPDSAASDVSAAAPPLVPLFSVYARSLDDRSGSGSRSSAPLRR